MALLTARRKVGTPPPRSNAFDDMEYEIFDPKEDGRKSRTKTNHEIGVGEQEEFDGLERGEEKEKIGFHYDVGLKRNWGVQPRVDTLQLVKNLRQGQYAANASRRAIFRLTPVDGDIVQLIEKQELCETPPRSRFKRRDPIFTQKSEYPLFGEIPLEMERFIGVRREKRLKFTAAAKGWESLPSPHPYAPEVAFAGRSNVGKSALVNALSLTCTARSANTPGHTQSLNFYTLRRPERMVLVDLPGYGFAHASEKDVREWNDLVDRYLTEREGLDRVFVVLDARHGIKQSDREMMMMLEDHRQPFQAVMSKTDMVFPKELAQRWWHVSKELETFKYAIPKIFMASAKTGAGVKSVIEELMQISEAKIDGAYSSSARAAKSPPTGEDGEQDSNGFDDFSDVTS